MIKICPARAGHRKGVVEKINHTAAQRWWRTLPDDLTIEQARPIATGSPSCMATPGCAAALPVTARPPSPPSRPASRCGRHHGSRMLLLSESWVVSRQALIAYRGNQYSMPPALAGATVKVTRSVGGQMLDIPTQTGIVVARHRLAPDGSGAQVRDHGHVAALDATAMKAAAAARGPHRPKERIPPGPAARAAAETLRGNPPPSSTVIDLASYERAGHGRNTLS